MPFSLALATPAANALSALQRVRDTIGGADQSPKRQRGVFVDRPLVFGPARLRSGLGSRAMSRATSLVREPPKLSRTPVPAENGIRQEVGGI